MATTQSPQGRDPATPPEPVTARDSTAGKVLRRELLVLGVALLCGLVLVPLAIWMVGNRILGPYTHGVEPAGGPMRLLGDFFDGLAHGSVIFWCVGLGPYLLISVARLFWGAVTHSPASTTVTSRR